MKISVLLWIILLSLFASLAAACQSSGEPAGDPGGDSTEVDASEETANQPRPMMGPGSGMMARHHATIPDEYAGLTSPVSPDQDSLARGLKIYTGQCATCHGEEGLGNGPAAEGLDPPPAPLAHTGRMMADDYLFWRISEGGAMPPFNSAMPSWKASLEETDRWHVINYIRSMSGGLVPGLMDPQEEAAKRGEMLTQAVEEGVISNEEAAIFDDVHAHMDALLADGGPADGPIMDQQDDIMAQLIEAGTITGEEAATFNDVHDRLLAAGLMQ